MASCVSPGKPCCASHTAALAATLALAHWCCPTRLSWASHDSPAHAREPELSEHACQQPLQVRWVKRMHQGARPAGQLYGALALAASWAARAASACAHGFPQCYACPDAGRQASPLSQATFSSVRICWGGHMCRNALPAKPSCRDCNCCWSWGLARQLTCS